MYTQFYGLDKKPFEITPDPRFFYASGQYKEALAAMVYGVKEKKGLIVLTGEVGTGKTLLIRSLLQMLDADTRTAFIFNPRLDLEDFFNVVASEFHLRGDLSTKGRFLKRFNAFLLRAAEQKKRAVLVVDEAQTLTLPILEEIRLLMNLETSSEKLLQVILSGQPELHKIINFNCMRQFKQRISMRCHLGPLSRKETGEYISRRLEVAGHNGKQLFTERAVRKIHKHSGGIPRLINAICDNALLTGYALEKKQIDLPIIEEVVGDLEGLKAGSSRKDAWPRDETELAMEWNRPRPKSRGPLRWAVAGAALFLLLIAALFFLSGGHVPEAMLRELPSVMAR